MNRVHPFRRGYREQVYVEVEEWISGQTAVGRDHGDARLLELLLQKGLHLFPGDAPAFRIGFYLFNDHLELLQTLQAVAFVLRVGGVGTEGEEQDGQKSQRSRGDPQIVWFHSSFSL